MYHCTKVYSGISLLEIQVLPVLFWVVKVSEFQCLITTI